VEQSVNTFVVRPEIGQWYLRRDKGEAFQVVAFDDRTRMVEIQSFDGDVDEMDAGVWSALPLERTEPPENWTGPLDDVETDDLGYPETDMKAVDWTQPLEPLKVEGEAWEEPEPEEERDALGEGRPAEPFSAEIAEADEQAK
jgi:hypothetical protein